VYLDGNTGVDGPGGSGRAFANSVEVDFFGRRIAVRRGVCQISLASQAPLLPLFAWWERGRKPAVEFLAPIVPEQHQSIQDFSLQGMQRLFQLAEQAIAGRPEQFEEWSRVHRWRVQGTRAALSSPGLLPPAQGKGEEARRYRLATERFLLLPAGEGPVLVEWVHGHILPAGPLLCDLLRVLGRRDASLQEVVERLGRRHSRAQLVGALTRLQQLELVEEVPARARAVNPVAPVSNTRGEHAT
jgi:hypothetical protein